MSKGDEVRKLSDVVSSMKSDIGKLLGTNITVAIVDAEGDIKYIDTEIKKFSDFIISFTKGNFDLLSVGDHSLPLSGTNIAFFKVSDEALVILNSDKGPVGQLLAFKGRMKMYAAQLDTLIEEATFADEEKIPVKAAVRVPVLTEPIANKKFGMEEAKVLHLVNGENTITDICEKTKLPQLKVDEILRKYQKKGWIKLKRLIIGLSKEAPETVTKPMERPEVPAVSPPTEPTTAPAHRVVEGTAQESVYLFPILQETFNEKNFPKADARILKYCDGQYTINDVVNETGLIKLEVMEIVKRYEKKGKLKLTKIIPSAIEAEELATPEPPSPELTVIPEIPEIPTISEVPEMPAFSTIPEIPNIPSPSAPLTPAENPAEEVIFDELMQLMDDTEPYREETLEPPSQVSPSPPPQTTPPQLVYTPISTPPPTFTPPPASSPPPAPVKAQEVPKPQPSPAPRAQVPPKVTPSEGSTQMVELKGEPVTDALFDDLANLLDATAPIDPQESSPPPESTPAPVQ
ncbi:MAG TPA: hypothetical protein VMV49_05210, partial [Candidatus Deferrimicrobium sp.]|nr:hypothetical protein [Candidatus Deferrimicrobium sp.]